MPNPLEKSRWSAALVATAIAFVGLSAPPALADGSVTVNDFTLTRGISNREPIDKAASFSSGDRRAFAFARIKNDGPPTTVNFVWHYGDEEHGSVSMNVGTSSGWRSWSSANLKPGDWRVEIHDANGMMLMSKAFTVGADTARNESNDMNREAVSTVTAVPAMSESDPMVEDGKPASETSGLDDNTR